MAESQRRVLPLVAGAIGIVTVAVVLLLSVGTTFLLSLLGVVVALTEVAPKDRLEVVNACLRSPSH
jgi:hypothetical protein